jgi:hypothetical protein
MSGGIQMRRVYDQVWLWCRNILDKGLSFVQIVRLWHAVLNRQREHCLCDVRRGEVHQRWLRGEHGMQCLPLGENL